MEISIDAPRDRQSRRALAFETRFHDADTLVQSVPADILDYRRLDEAARAIQQTVLASDSIEAYVLSLWSAIRNPKEAGLALDGVEMDRLVIGGASPRGMSALLRAARVHAWLAGRDMLVPEDIRAVFAEVMSHRIFLDPVYELRRERIMPEFRRALFDAVPAP
jgi:MoxR-like ATPase